jgi:hypothetical protein
VTTTAIAAVVARRPTILVGRVVAVEAHVRPWVRFNVEFCDGTGTVILRFMGRTEVPGLVPGRRMSVDGTPSMEGDSLIMLNPLYTLLDDDVQEG